MNDKTKITSNRLLAVEGKDENNFFKAMLKHKNIKNIQVIDIGGKDQFKTRFPLLINLDGFSDVKALGFIRDAEENQAHSAFSSIRDILKKNGLHAPKSINTIIDEQDMRIGVFIMPNNIDEGMLEDLCLESVKEKLVFECVEQYIKCCMKSLTEDKKNINISKAKIQTYLAVQKPVVNSLGLAAIKKYWDFEDSCFSDIKQFLHSLSI